MDYSYLMCCLREYRDPRGKIKRMLRSGEIIRIKKGLYCLGENSRRGFIQRDLLANLIYGPSYVSGLFALSAYGLIPEKVETVTSMTTKRNKFFSTPIGDFEYVHINPARYWLGVQQKRVGGSQFCFFASAEKALADTVAKEIKMRSKVRLREFLFENMRIDEVLFAKLDLREMNAISILYKSPVVRLLNELLKEVQHEKYH